MKKLISVFLVLILLLSTVAASTAALGAYNANLGVSDYPTVTFAGKSGKLFDGSGNEVYSGKVYVDSDFIKQAVSDCLPSFKDALLKGNWEAWGQKLASVIAPLYSAIAMDENGEPKNGTHANVASNEALARTNRTASNGKYTISSYSFAYDWRVDPLETADSLNEYISQIKQATGKDKVNIVCSCEGGMIATTYLAKFGADDVNVITYHAGTQNGADHIASIFSGNFNFDGDAVLRYKNQQLEVEDPLLSAILDSIIDTLADTYSIEAFGFALKPVFENIYKYGLSKAMLASYASMPGIWACIPEEELEDAKKGIFAGEEEKYAGLIEKIDNYDKVVRQNVTQIFDNTVSSGARIGMIAKYGTFTLKFPIGAAVDRLSDGTVTVTHSTNGAKTARYGYRFSDSYVKKAEKNGTAKYISSDKTIDASTAQFPDKTWFVCNVEHNNTPSIINEIIQAFIASDGELTVWDNEAYPQYLSFNAETNTAEALTKENGAAKKKTGFEPAKAKNSILDLIGNLINYILQRLGLSIRWKGID